MMTLFLSRRVFDFLEGEPTHVRIRFTSKVARYVTRRRWHSSQKFKDVRGGIELEMDLKGETEVLSWVLGFGKEAEVLEPPELRSAVKAELEGGLAAYR
jgi:proteasome accessory factor B